MPDVSDALNKRCHCRTVSTALLSEHLDAQSGMPGLAERMAAAQPHMFSSTTVFMSREMLGRVHEAVAVLERVITSKPYQEAILPAAPAIARLAFGPRGVFMGFDFHIDDTGPRLIEINTNAGGAMLNTILARANQACCAAMDWALKPDESLSNLEDSFHEMFMEEWRSQRGSTPLKTVAIVDDDPPSQYLAPEFALFKQMLERRGLRALVLDACALRWESGKLMYQDEQIDLVYNRLTDFYLSEDRHAALRSAYEAGAVVMTPHPAAHALYADKRNLIALSDEAVLASWHVSPADRRVLAAVVPRTIDVTADRADAMWQERGKWFFKPKAGYASKGAYRGDKLTRKVWEEIKSADYVAQAFVPPSGRSVLVDDAVVDLKVDLRAYVYAGQVQLLAARMYQGQTTNLRTAGGGFAPVVVLPH